MMDRKAFFLLGFIMFLTMTGYGIVLPTLPFLADDLNLTSVQMSSLIIVWAIAQMITSPIWGRLADKIGRKPVLIMGVLGFGIAFLMLIFAQNYWQLLLVRLIGAAISSGAHPAAFSMVADQTKKEFRNESIAKMGAVNGLGFLCGPAIGGLFSPLGVTVPFIIAGSLALITLPFAHFYIQDKMIHEDDSESSQQKEAISFWKSILMITKTGYWNHYTIILGLSIAASSFFGLLGYFMIERFDATPVFVSLAFSAQAGISVVVQFFLLKKCYDLWDEETITKIGLVITTIGYCFISFAPFIWVAIVGCLLTGLGQSLVRPTTIAMLSKRNEMGQGITMGLQNSMDSLGRILGPLWGGWVFVFLASAPFITSAIITALLLGIAFISAYQQKIHITLPDQKDTSNS
ncbi:MFS transporter [Ureibacillus sinduriensis]|uniref:MFS transporter permease n=1 Tax=Ureibacillus sinduriensis BLB-1 = JCM 15800 TaxID=1384057 RepID=A0A0A3HQF1_9BACL|nr:MFS transporter [Ureibacillus sinduriensis]KGR74771.1 MFS transporter permease [Ureibacillus sinduriensis BLB-1 = JCM 15800]